MLDSSFDVSFTVTQNTGGTITNVVPNLNPPPCTIGGQPIFDTTYTGYTGGSATSLAVPSWPNGQQQTLHFTVHLYAQPNDGNSLYCTDIFQICGAGNLEFQMQFTYDNQANPVTAPSSSALIFDPPPADGFFVEDIHSITLPNQCCEHTTVTFNLFLSALAYNQNLINDPDIHVLLGANWNLHNQQFNLPFSSGLGVFNYPINESSLFPLRDKVVLGELNMLPETTSVFDINGTRYQLDLLGGSGPAGLNCSHQTWNFFDLTDQTLQQNGPTIKQMLRPLGGNLVVQGATNDTVVNIREVGIFLARQGGCSLAQAFGQPPSNFEFTQLHLDQSGQAQVGIQVPSAWSTLEGSVLSNDYSIQWYYRRHNTFVRATRPGGGGTDPKALTETLGVSFTDPNEIQVEARITHIPSGSMISITSPTHGFNYAGVSSGVIRNDDNDIYVDPGESFVIPLDLQNVTGATAQNVTITLGSTSPASAEFGFAGETGAQITYADTSGIVFQNLMLNGQTLEIDLLYQLLCITQSCDSFQGFIDVAYQSGNFQSSYRQAISAPVNCEFVRDTVSIAQNGWTDDDCFGTPDPCSNSNCTEFQCTPTPNGWAFSSGSWSGQTDTRFFFYTLRSPAFIVGNDSEIHMRHFADFDLLEAGGIAEFRTRNTGGAWSLWQDLITPLETAHGVTLYNTRTFSNANIPAGVDNLIGGRNVFMDMTLEQEFDLAVPAGLFVQDEIQFRFTFQQPLITDMPQGSWTISDFDYSSEFPQGDNLLQIPTNQIFSSCLAEITLVPGLPGTYTYSWYTSLENLAMDLPDHISLDGTWPGFPIPPQDSTYYVRITDTNSLVSRIGKFTVQAQSMVPPFAVVLEAWQTFGFPITADINEDGEVDVRDLVLQILLDECT